MFILLLTLISLSAADYSSKSHRKHLAELASNLDWNALKSDILAVLTNSEDFWPADWGHYGPFMIRQAWHCAGTYRAIDGLGGCDGARQRFEPERSWDDNTNLDKAKTLLWPIKQKYGLGLSWGDLIVLTGNTAIESMGGPVLGFCGGRIDDYDGKESELLDPKLGFNETHPCAVNGACQSPFGATTMGLIYVNPEGPMGKPVPEESVHQVRDTFHRMGMNDKETVALIGGGHAFGKSHGACPLGPGPAPKEDPVNPWPGNCGSGKGKDTFTSGFEGSWSPTPTKWSNSFFTGLVSNSWRVHIGPGGHHQWESEGAPGIMMLTSDVSLLKDTSYLNIVQTYASNLDALNDAFSNAWYKLTTRDMGPVTRCIGPFVPPAQPFQNPLPPTPAVLPDYNCVKAMIRTVIKTDASSILEPDFYDNSAYYGGIFVHLAYQCASTFRQSDYLGGCNGARIRFSPQIDWSINVGVEHAIALLAQVQQSFENLSWADLIVLAGTVALEDATLGQVTIPFCPGRTDATDGTGSNHLHPNGDYSATIEKMKRDANRIGLTERETVALMGRLRSPKQLERSGFHGSWTSNPTTLSNTYFQTLLGETWEPYIVPQTNKKQYKALGKDLYILPVDLNIHLDPSYRAIAEEFAVDNLLFLQELASAWTKLMNIDRFDGPVNNLCSSDANLPPGWLSGEENAECRWNEA